MSIAFAEPDPPLRVNAAREIASLDAHFGLRGVPVSTPNRLLLASWNIANLGVQDRSEGACKVIAHVLSRFDLVAVQEINDDYRKFLKIVRLMGDEFDFVLSDTAGNDERLGYVYRVAKVTPGNLWGEIALRPREYPKRDVVVHYRANRQDRVQTFRRFKYTPFDRNPFIGSFKAGEIDMVLANVHLYFGAFQKSSNLVNRKKYARRVLEIYALAKWAKDRSVGGNAWDKDIILIGDMNVPNMDDNKATLKALEEFSWKSAEFFDRSDRAATSSLSRIGGSNLGNDKTYDQIAFAPTALKNSVVSYGVFDFDQAVFAGKWESLSSVLTKGKAVSKFNSYLRRYISDHRPVWVELRTS